MALKIGDLAHAAGTSASAVRYYEGIGLMPAPDRRGGQRRYGQADLRRLTFIRRCRDFGFPIEQVRSLLSLMQDGERPCMEARDVAAAHLTSVREKISELCALERSIATFVHAADDSCSGGSGAECVVLEELAEPGYPAR